MSRTLVRYTIPLDSTGQPAHRLGVNSLAVDPSNAGTLYSAGRDGVILAWDLKMSLSRVPHRYDDERLEVQVDSIDGDASYKRAIQAHTHWVNQIALSADNQTVYSCSSDTFVKSWRPNAFVNDKPETIGTHGDYVKCLAAPKHTSEWIASAGLDRSIVLWDTSGKGERLRIDDHSKDGGMKQSIYSLTSGPNLLASGGIEKVIRVWDTRSGGRVTKFIGHTDNVRSLLCSDDGKTFISASSDTTIKIWDLTAGRCLHTMTTHSEPVWTLLSDHPRLAVFHAADKSGMVTKTDIRPQSNERDEESIVAVCQEASGVNSLAQIGENLYTATASSDINRWQDHETAPSDPFADDVDAPLSRIESSTSARSRGPHHGPRRHSSMRQRRPTKFVLGVEPIAQTSTKSTNGGDDFRRTSLWSQTSVVSLTLEDETGLADSIESLRPLRLAPESIIRGQAGLQAHCMLPDRRRVLTRDSDGFVKLWDIIQCRQLSDYGKVDMDDVEAKLQSVAVVGSWCSVNTRVGALTVELDPRNMLDAETYTDSIVTDRELDFETRNQRFSLGKWVLKGLFQELIEAERAQSRTEETRVRNRRPGRLDLGDLSSTSNRNTPGSLETPRAGMTTPSFGSKNPYASAMATPGASIGLATPAPTYNPRPNGTNHQSQGSLSSLGSNKDTMSSPTTPGDYFSSPHSTQDLDATPLGNEPSTPGSVPKTPGGSSLMKNMKWLRSSKPAKAPVTDLRKAAPMVSTPNATAPMAAPVSASEPPRNFRDLVDQTKKAFSEGKGPLAAEDTRRADTWWSEMDPMPALTIPKTVGLSIALFQPGEGEAKDIYRGTVGTIGADMATVTPLLPVWLAQILLLNDTPAGMQNLESNKHYFSFCPHPTSHLTDPFNTVPSNLMRLGAARSLRIRKALTYISQRLPADVVEREGGGRKEEEWLEIVINGRPVDPDWTLMMARRHLWKQGGDMKLEYKLKRE